jgi:probable F420-dependent oxidoreductase
MVNIVRYCSRVCIAVKSARNAAWFFQPAKGFNSAYNKVSTFLFFPCPGKFSKELGMKLGIVLPNVGPLNSREGIQAVSTEAEKIGLDSLWVTERLLYPLHPKQVYAGRFAVWPEGYKSVLDPLDTLVFAASITEKIRLGTSLLDFPFYNAARLAKRIATMDVLSGGRAVICAGLGWSEDEFLASGVPFQQRAGRTAEMIRALTALWGPDPVEFHGKYFEAPASIFGPKPIQKPRPPLLLGGFAPGALRRAARLADGFNPIIRPNATEAEKFFLAAHQAWQEAGRAPAKPLIVARVNHGFITDQPIQAERLFMTGSIDQVRGDLEKLADWGATEVFFDIKTDSLQTLLDQARKLHQAGYTLE